MPYVVEVRGAEARAVGTQAEAELAVRLPRKRGDEVRPVEIGDRVRRVHRPQDRGSWVGGPLPTGR